MPSRKINCYGYSLSLASFTHYFHILFKLIIVKGGLLGFGLWIFGATAHSANNTLNVYVWYNEIPPQVLKKFETETGIHVNYSYYDSNEELYAKLKATSNTEYDVIEPSNYFVDRMRRQGMLHELDKSKLSNAQNLMPVLLNPIYDPQNKFSIPYIWGVTGIFVNKKYHDPKTITRWSDFWDKKYYNQLMLLNDQREVFSMGLLSLGYSPNDANAEHIKQAYEHIRALLPNIKVFNADAIPSIFIDEDVNIGMAWNGDIFRSLKENPDLDFIYPQDGFVIWVDCFAIPKHAPHAANAYKFLNFLMRPDNAKEATLLYGYPSASIAAKALLPESYKTNQMIYPTPETLKRGIFQTSVDQKTLGIYSNYWELLKLNA